jgi:pimeloyl-ACP methyl ester carboxylesterase
MRSAVITAVALATFLALTFVDANGDFLTNPSVTYNPQGIAEVLYQVPDSFVRWGAGPAIEDQDKAQPERSVQITLNGQTQGVPQIRLTRPPVVLVHGVWGDANTWNQFEPLLQAGSKPFTTVRANYSRGDYNNAGPFSQNYPVIGESIEQALGEAGKDQLAATKVDLITHSLGGLLVREYCRQNPTCADQIHKLITLDTPYSGSELASLIVQQRSDPNNCITKSIIPALHDDGKHTDLGAVDDLAINSPALQKLTGLALAFPTDAIAGLTEDPLPGYDGGIKKLWRGVSLLCGYIPGPTSTMALFAWEIFNSGSFISIGTEGTPVFSEANDRIVSQSSQLGGLPTENTFPLLGFDHITIHDSADVVKQVIELLEQPIRGP